MDRDGTRLIAFIFQLSREEIGQVQTIDLGVIDPRINRSLLWEAGNQNYLVAYEYSIMRELGVYSLTNFSTKEHHIIEVERQNGTQSELLKH
jgi:hypothetical protein